MPHLIGLTMNSAACSVMATINMNIDVYRDVVCTIKYLQMHTENLQILFQGTFTYQVVRGRMVCRQSIFSWTAYPHAAMPGCSVNASNITSFVFSETVKGKIWTSLRKDRFNETYLCTVIGNHFTYIEDSVITSQSLHETTQNISAITLLQSCTIQIHAIRNALKKKQTLQSRNFPSSCPAAINIISILCSPHFKNSFHTL